MQIDTENFSWFQVPDEVKKLLILAASNWENTSESEKYINLALTKAENNTDILVAAYRYFYYKNNYIMALKAARTLIDKIKEADKLPGDWEQLKPILLNRKQEPSIRLYLNAYAASGLVLAKLGQLDQAQEICTQIKEIDDTNEFQSAGILLDILTKPSDEDED
ncbi:MAG: hypothetical protein QNJ47_12935 [Nostocaceae cyanobacterium]|nr:hypothetical protein [Nostocaceae cyanobacterium]